MDGGQHTLLGSSFAEAMVDKAGTAALRGHNAPCFYAPALLLIKLLLKQVNVK